MPSHFSRVLPFFKQLNRIQMVGFLQVIASTPFRCLCEAEIAEARLWEATQAATTRSSAFTGLEHVEDAKSYRLDDQSNLMSPVRLTTKSPSSLNHIPDVCFIRSGVQHDYQSIVGDSAEMKTQSVYWCIYRIKFLQYILGNLAWTYIDHVNMLIVRVGRVHSKMATQMAWK